MYKEGACCVGEGAHVPSLLLLFYFIFFATGCASVIHVVFGLVLCFVCVAAGASLYCRAFSTTGLRMSSPSLMPDIMPADVPLAQILVSDLGRTFVRLLIRASGANECAYLLEALCAIVGEGTSLPELDADLYSIGHALANAIGMPKDAYKARALANVLQACVLSPWRQGDQSGPGNVTVDADAALTRITSIVQSASLCFALVPILFASGQILGAMKAARATRRLIADAHGHPADSDLARVASEAKATLPETPPATAVEEQQLERILQAFVRAIVAYIAIHPLNTLNLDIEHDRSVSYLVQVVGTVAATVEDEATVSVMRDVLLGLSGQRAVPQEQVREPQQMPTIGGSVGQTLAQQPLRPQPSQPVKKQAAAVVAPQDNEQHEKSDSHTRLVI